MQEQKAIISWKVAGVSLGLLLTLATFLVKPLGLWYLRCDYIELLTDLHVAVEKWDVGGPDCDCRELGCDKKGGFADSGQNA